MLCFCSIVQAQSISFFDLTNLTNLSIGQAHTYLTLGNVFKHQYLEEIDGKKIKVFGNGVSNDISVAGILSFVDGLNKLEYKKKMNGFSDKVEAHL